MNIPHTRYKPRERCGRPLATGGRKRPIFVCLDCKTADPEYMRMRTRSAAA